jgi:hypothetical protein
MRSPKRLALVDLARDTGTFGFLFSIPVDFRKGRFLRKRRVICQERKTQGEMSGDYSKQAQG